MAGNYGNPYKSVRYRRGNQGDLPILDDGEPGFCIDTGNLFVGNGGANQQITGGGSGSAILAVGTKTGAYTMANSDDVILMNAAGAVNLTMQANSAATKKVYRVKNLGPGPVTILPNGGDQFFALGLQSSLVISDMGVAFDLIPDGTGVWHVF